MRRIAAFAAWMALAACGRGTHVVTRAVTLHATAACPVGGRAQATLSAFGDFQPSGPAGVSDQYALDDVGRALADVPAGTRALSVAVSAAGTSDAWRGVAGVADQGDVDVLVLPATRACALSQPATAGALVDRTDAAFGALDARRVLVAGGGAGGAVPASFVADLGTGVLTPVASELLAPRAGATVTAFGAGGLVAGGARPDSGELLQSAEVLTNGAFDGAPILLNGGRASHAAVVLATGETLLVGGAGEKGALASLEIVDPTTRRARVVTTAALEHPRTSPTALRLASGEILVAGGFDAAGAPVPWLEWLTADASAHSKHSRELVASAERGFVALPGGGALAVVAAPTPTPDGFKNVWVISADGDLESATPVSGALAKVRLFRGNSGAPLLWTGDRWLRWQPWKGEFQIVDAVDATVGPERALLASPDDGVAAWLGADGAHATVYALRFDTRSAFTTDSASGPLLVFDATLFAPDRLVDGSAGAPITFDASRGLVLDPGASAFLADATFAAFTLDLAATSAAPIVVLRDAAGSELEIGGATCPVALPTAPTTVHVERDAQRVRVRFGDGAPRECAGSVAPTARVSIGLRGRPDGASSATSFVVTRR